MKYIAIILMLCFELFSSVIKAPILSVNDDTITIKVDHIDVGVSGFVIHKIAPQHTSILKNCIVEAYNPKTKIAILKMSDFSGLANNSLPHGLWKVKVGDSVELAFGYSRSLLIAPSEKVYYQIIKHVQTQWIDPDMFATILSFRGHPTPLKEDFYDLSDSVSVGLLFIFLDKKLYTIDMKSFKILNVSDAPLTQDNVKLPFFTRIEDIDANWFGDGSKRMDQYEPHYYELLVKYNPKNKTLYEMVKNNKNPKVKKLKDRFEIGK